MTTKKYNHEVGEMYFDLLKKSLTRYGFDDGYASLVHLTSGGVKDKFYSLVNKQLYKFGLEIVANKKYDPKKRRVGIDWPATAETMIGLKRLDNIQYCAEDVLSKGIQGDFIETGVWRGGATIFMRAILKAYGITDRNVWVADSFEGLPKTTDISHEQDVKDELWKVSQLAISLNEVKNNFRKYGLLDNRVKFLKGWFKDTLPSAPIKKLAIMRLDGDMYESTLDALNSLYPKLAIGGYAIIDDYCLLPCREALNDFRLKFNIKEKMIPIDWASVFWKRSI